MILENNRCILND